MFVFRQGGSHFPFSDKVSCERSLVVKRGRKSGQAFVICSDCKSPPPTPHHPSPLLKGYFMELSNIVVSFYDFFGVFVLSLFTAL